MKTSAVLLFVLVVPVAAFGRLGETRAEMSARYGEPKSVTTQPVTKKITTKLIRWHTKTMIVDAVELDGRIIGESYRLTFRDWTDEEISTTRETQAASEPEKFREWEADGPTAWAFRDRATVALLDDGRTLRFRVWGYEGKLNPYARPESIR